MQQLLSSNFCYAAGLQNRHVCILYCKKQFYLQLTKIDLLYLGLFRLFYSFAIAKKVKLAANAAVPWQCKELIKYRERERQGSQRERQPSNRPQRNYAAFPLDLNSMHQAGLLFHSHGRTFHCSKISYKTLYAVRYQRTHILSLLREQYKQVA